MFHVPCFTDSDTFSLAQFQHFRLHVWLYLHIDFGVCVRSTFQHSGAALPAPPLGGVLGGADFSLVFCCVVLLGLLRAVFLVGLLFPCLLLGGAAWPPPSLGRGALPPHMMGWVLWGVGVLGCWAVGSGVGVLGGSVVRCCVLCGVLGGWVWRWCLVVECWVGCWVARRGVQCLDWCRGILESMFSCFGSNIDEIDTEE